MYLPEDLQDALKDDGATYSLVKTGGFAFKEEEKDNESTGKNGEKKIKLKL